MYCMLPAGRFQPTLPARGATQPPLRRFCRPRYFNPRSPHGERRHVAPYALHGYSDFNPRSPHGERPSLTFPVQTSWTFQPTLPARGATTHFLIIGIPRENFNPRSPHGERQLPADTPRPRDCISTHAPRTGSDRPRDEEVSRKRRFQPTLPARGATPRGGRTRRRNGISTHAPRTGSDDSGRCALPIHRDFNPRSPHGERRCVNATSLLKGDFNPRSPHGERLVHTTQVGVVEHFNPRSPHGERRLFDGIIRANTHFNPRSPHGERRKSSRNSFHAMRFQPTLPARGATGRRERPKTATISTHAPRTGSDAQEYAASVTETEFQPTLPARGATA